MSQKLLVCGGRRLQGEIELQGAKNSVLPILAASILTAEPVILRRCPQLSDVYSSIKILQELGCVTQWEEDTLIVDSSGLHGCSVSEPLMREMRSSSVFLGAILARCGQAELSYPGGCELGPRPIDLHIAGLRELGAEIIETGGAIHCKAAALRGKDIVLSLPSVGATENIMLAACGGQGVTRIFNAAREPEIIDLQNFLLACGAKVSGAGGNVIVIEGSQGLAGRDSKTPQTGNNKKAGPLHGCVYQVMPDRIVAATWLCALAACGGEIYIRHAQEEYLSNIIASLREAGCAFQTDADGLRCIREKPLTAIKPVRTAPYPGFPTDAQAILMAALLQAKGCTVFEENMFSSRYRHVDELIRMGANIQVSGRVAVVTGVEHLCGTSLCCTDLRGGAALCIAALAAGGKSQIREIQHIDRGYVRIEQAFSALGADIHRVDE